MWKMIDFDTDCTECGYLYAPPKFNIPPPPVDVHKYGYRSCEADTEAFLQNQNNLLETDMCQSMLIFDEVYNTSRAIQVSVITAVFLLFLFALILISSLCIWKYKKKAQNSIHCKRSSGHDNLESNTVDLMNSHLPYGYSTINLEHLRPLVAHRPFNNELLHISSIRGNCCRPQQCLLPSSPGPDPYRSCENMNVYEELDVGSHSYGSGSSSGSQTCVNSDDEFAEDELSIVEANPSGRSKQPNLSPIGNPPQCCSCNNTIPSNAVNMTGRRTMTNLISNGFALPNDGESHARANLISSTIPRNMPYNASDSRKMMRKRAFLQAANRTPNHCREQRNLFELAPPKKSNKISPMWAKESYGNRTISPNSIPAMAQYMNTASNSLNVMRGKRYTFNQPAMLSLDRRQRIPNSGHPTENCYEPVYHIRNDPYNSYRTRTRVHAPLNEPTYSVYDQSVSYRNTGNKYVGGESVGSDSGYSNRTTSSISNCQEYDVHLPPSPPTSSQPLKKPARKESVMPPLSNTYDDSLLKTSNGIESSTFGNNKTDDHQKTLISCITKENVKSSTNFSPENSRECSGEKGECTKTICGSLP